MKNELSFFNNDEFETWREIRGWLLPEAAESLYKYAKLGNTDGTTVEIGSYAGKSTVCIGKALDQGSKEFCAIDLRFQPDFHQNIARFGLQSRLRTQEGPSLDHFEGWKQPISFLYIDGHHGKGYALADLLLWDMFVIPGGYVALDDTAGFMIGPNLQVQAATMRGAYELLEESGGITFLRKNHSIIPISYSPLSYATWFASLHKASADLGATDPWFRQPRLPSLKIPLSEYLDRFWHTCPAETFALMRRKTKQIMRSMYPSGDKHLINKHATKPNSAPANAELAWLKENESGFVGASATLTYLEACHLMRSGCLETAKTAFDSLTHLESNQVLLHYRIPVRDVAFLRLGQIHDLLGDRETAASIFRSLTSETTEPVIKTAATGWVGSRFSIPIEPDYKLLREFNLDWHEYKRQLPAEHQA